MTHPNDRETARQDGMRLARYTGIDRRKGTELESDKIRDLHTRPRVKDTERPKRYMRIERGYRA